MPRSNRPRGRDRRAEPDDAWLERVLSGGRRVETHRDGAWHVQSIAAASAQKQYLCPGCGLQIEPGTAHVVAWRADGIMGEQNDLAARRHWHAHCWRIRN